MESACFGTNYTNKHYQVLQENQHLPTTIGLQLFQVAA